MPIAGGSLIHRWLMHPISTASTSTMAKRSTGSNSNIPPLRPPPGDRGEALASSGLLLRGGEVAEALGRRHHQEAIAFADDTLDVAALHMRMADHDIVLLAGVDHALHPLQQLRMLILARDAELLTEIAFADQDGADAGHLGQHGVEVFDTTGVLDLQNAENLALRIERPHVGFIVIVLLAEPPIARGRGRAVAPDTDGFIVLRA